jgi:hypothetical protein
VKKANKSLLFLKKKKQKEFYHLASIYPSGARAKTNKSFLVLFFKKEHASLWL